MSNKVGHTPGQWILGAIHDGWQDVNASDANWYALARVVVQHSDGRTDKLTPDAAGEANAQLIASAPELLSALREIHKLYLCPEPKRIKDWSARVDVMADYARKAIAKVEGR